MDIRHLVGGNVRRRRLELRLTQEQFATASGFAQQYLSDLERGRRNVTLLTLHELAGALELRPYQLLLEEHAALDAAVGGPDPEASDGAA